MNVFLSYAVGPSEGSIPERLSAVAAAYGISLLLPDRTYPSSDSLNADTMANITQSDAIIALVTITGPPELWNVVNSELRHALQSRKPVIYLMETCAPFQTPPGAHLVYFDRFNPVAHESSLTTTLDEIRVEHRNQDFTALAWIAGIAVGLVAISELSSEDK
jgi:hypothetical protein